MQQMSRMASKGQIVASVTDDWCEYDEANLNEPCKLCNEHGFTCSAADKVHRKERTRILSRELGARIRSETISAIPCQLSDPSMEGLTPKDLRLLADFHLNIRTKPIHFVCFFLRWECQFFFQFPDIPMSLLSSKLAKAAILTLVCALTQMERDVQKWEYYGRFCQLAVEALENGEIEELAVGTFFPMLCILKVNSFRTFLTF